MIVVSANFISYDSCDNMNPFANLFYSSITGTTTQSYRMDTASGHLAICLNSNDKNDTNAFYQKFNEVNQLIFVEMRKLFEMGVADGSIRNDEDIDYLTYTTIYSAVSFFHLYSFTGISFTKSLNLDSDKFVYFTIEHMIAQIKSK